jgi:ethanolamine utilization protein EutP
MKRTILIGKTGSGKTTLVQRVEGRLIHDEKTQMVVYHNSFIDTPGEYIEMRSLYRALIVTAADADIIAFVQACTDEEVRFPPGLASIFPKETIGVVTKIDLAADRGGIERPREVLLNAGAAKIFEISALADIGVDELVAFLMGQHERKEETVCAMNC